MAEIAPNIVIGQLLAVVREAQEGPPERWSYFTDNRSDAGFFGTLGPLTAADASRQVAGTSVAAHIHHAAWAMGATAAWIRGDRSRRDWKESWQVNAVDDAAWKRLVGELRRQYEELRQSIQAHALDGEEAFGGAVGAIAHLAYHLGAVRQKIAVLRTL
jgi:hypothetical protein